MRYEFHCDCGIVKDIFASIKEGPPSIVVCECGRQMFQSFGTAFILVGDGWPGKDIKGDYQSDRKTATLVDSLDEYDAAKKESKRVLEERRKGKKSFKEFARHNKPVVERYRKNLKKGIKGNDGETKTYTLRDLQHQKPTA